MKNYQQRHGNSTSELRVLSIGSRFRENDKFLAQRLHTHKEMNMQAKQQSSFFSVYRNIFANGTPAKKPVANMRPLSDEEVRIVAGGPEVEVDDGNG